MFFSNLTQIRNLFESLPSEERKTVVLLDISVTPLIYTPFGGLQPRGTGLARLAGGFILMDSDEIKFQATPGMPYGQSFGSRMNICTRRRRVVGRGLHPAVGVAAVLEDELIN